MQLTILNSVDIHFDRDSMLKVLICVVWSALLVGHAKGIINRLPVFGDFSELTQAALIVIPLILALPSIVNKLCLADYLFYSVCAVYYMSGYVAFPENSKFLNEYAFQCLCCVVPYYFIGRLIDINNLFKVLIILSTICIFADLFYFLVYTPSTKVVEGVENEDNMYQAYKSLPHVAMMLWATMEKPRIWKAVVFILGILFLLSCGTRGPLACIGFFGIIYFFFYMNFKGAVYLKVLIVSTSLIILVNLRAIAVYLASTFTSLNLSTRILQKIVVGEMGNDSQRSGVRDIIYKALDDGDHFWGLGLFGCQNYNVHYPHFLPLDFASTFGYAIGSFFLVILVLFIGWAFLITRGTKTQVFILFLFSISIIKLLLSNTFALEPFFFMLIGVCAKEIISRKSWTFLNRQNE